MNKSLRTLWAVCGGLLFATSATWAQDTSPTDAAVGQHQITDCMTQSDPAAKKEDAQQICREKFRQGIKIDKSKKKKKEPANKPPEAATAPPKDTTPPK